MQEELKNGQYNTFFYKIEGASEQEDCLIS